LDGHGVRGQRALEHAAFRLRKRLKEFTGMDLGEYL
jgi:hypothetical protein